MPANNANESANSPNWSPPSPIFHAANRRLSTHQFQPHQAQAMQSMLDAAFLQTFRQQQQHQQQQQQQQQYQSATFNFNQEHNKPQQERRLSFTNIKTEPMANWSTQAWTEQVRTNTQQQKRRFSEVAFKTEQQVHENNKKLCISSSGSLISTIPMASPMSNASFPISTPSSPNDTAPPTPVAEAEYIRSTAANSNGPSTRTPASPPSVNDDAEVLFDLDELPIRKVHYPFWAPKIREHMRNPLDEKSKEELCARVVAKLRDDLRAVNFTIAQLVQITDKKDKPMHVKKEGSKYFPRKNRTSRFIHHSFNCNIEASFAAAIYRASFTRGGAIGLPNFCELFMPRKGACLVQHSYGEVEEDDVKSCSGVEAVDVTTTTNVNKVPPAFYKNPGSLELSVNDKLQSPRLTVASSSQVVPVNFATTYASTAPAQLSPGSQPNTELLQYIMQKFTQNSNGQQNQ
mmetsp:Transcript_9323/g.18383  ORF Transcript_9323/g.18383 Transcript_9323/m.18383 type:complete len:459 (-) Transcript_9323:431-1807(-)